MATFDDRYRLADENSVLTPAVAVYPELIKQHLATSIEMAGGPERMRPHVKTHKTKDLTRLELEAGITKHKCATIAEAELLAETGVRDIVIAYQMVGPNLDRLVRLTELFSTCSFKPLVDHPGPIQSLGETMTAAGMTAEVLLDLDVGQGRTGVSDPDQAARLYRMIHNTPGLKVGGLHIYDGHLHQADPAERSAAVDQIWRNVQAILRKLDDFQVPRLVCGGTGSFPRCGANRSGGASNRMLPGYIFP